MTGSDKIFEQVIDLADGRLDDDASRRVRRLIDTEAAWQDASSWVATFQAATDGATLVELPASTRRMLEGLLPARRSVADEFGSLVRRVARLVHDQAAGAAFAGARGASATRRQLVFEIEGTDLVLDLACEADRVECAGQVLGLGDGFTLVVTCESGELRPDVDEFGEFTCSVPDTAFLRIDLVSATDHATVDLTPFLGRGEGAPA